MSLSPADSRGRRIADAIREALEVRRGEVLTPEVIQERANNAAAYVIEELDLYDEPGGRRNPGDIKDEGATK